MCGNIYGRRILISKPEVFGFGLNFQHCHKTVYFANFSFERWYQSIRRLYRFGQKHPVDCHLIFSENEMGIVGVLKRKQHDFEAMASEMSDSMRDGMYASLYGRSALAKYRPHKAVSIPDWMKG